MVQINLGKPSYDKRLIPVLIDKGIFVNEKIFIENKEYILSCVTIGDPYVVVLNKKISGLNINDTALKINYNRVFPYKVNILFSEVINNEIYFRVWDYKDLKSILTAAAASLVANTLYNKVNKNEYITIHEDNNELIGIFKNNDDVLINSNLKVKTKKML